MARRTKEVSLKKAFLILLAVVCWPFGGMLFSIPFGHRLGWVLYFAVQIYGVIAWVRWNSVDARQTRAGKWAEKEVARHLRRIASRCNGVVLNNLLLVVNRDRPDEFSMELDHLLITPHNVFVVESKHRTGTIWVKDDAREWEVRTAQRSSRMRNALVQVKNTCRQLNRFFDAPYDAIPVVAIASKQGTVEIQGGISNVVTPDRLDALVTAFDRTYEGRQVDVKRVAAEFAARHDNSTEARDKHIKRALAAQQKSEAERERSEASATVKGASL
ncbi:nuclease-related domain-containing protein [Paraburkholderia sp. J8-2]|uniref:nuclease-related domain-containing protein n=1 Tax=Paraburkholderia sp. J8-2 TaxID=2805440 RepID=UPI002AB789E1|nr:nuclease-related domain-containing protein [Paraburkholderia sp. J8-2]